MEIFENEPDRPLNDILSEMLKGYASDMPSQNLLMITEFIIAEWEKLQTGEKVEEQEAMFA